MSTNKKEKKKSSYEAKKGTKRSRMGCLRWMLWLIHYILDSLVDFIFKFIYDDANRKLLIPVKHSFLVESATGLAEKIRNKELSSEKLVQACIDRIVEVNADLNCVVDSRFQEALAEARGVDQFLESTSLSVDELRRDKPFLGVPFTSKESTHASGMKNTFGLVSRRDCKATVDAEIVVRVKAGGGILLAITNVPELNLWQETRNNVYGQTNNPFNVNRTAGGSSGGEAVAIAACASPFGIGTDIGGSARMPGFFCGIYGHKPTTGLISTRGMTFRTGQEKEKTMVTAGPMTRYAADIIPFLKLLVGDNVSKLKLDNKVDMASVRLSYVVEPGDLRVSAVTKEMRSIILQAVTHLEQQCGSQAHQLNLPGFRYSYTLWRYWMSKEPGNFAFDLGNKKHEVSWLMELPKMLMGQSQHTLPAMLKLLETAVFPPVPAKWAEEETTKLREALIEELGDDGVLIFPSHPTPAHHHYVPFFRPYNFAYWAIINVLHFPATQVPLGLSRDGLPLGLQVVATPYNDHLCIAVAKELENGFGGYVPPCAVVSYYL
ncbi:fatty-acid amide hydrolase 2-like isoform X4 [Homalodisca vitripennis]|nr:fatty-acid amide hydrolase 2-like isoform X2 [Homalodisca vitripennis]XP_046674418.1 fatty-acid amide hydrolase 2-like isoform X3 [Homalodisca vitripennis]XP_046674419.1 fatty-acid amide hydrolase 2-like isoform X4 [Homalodisca vitripennis]